MDLNYYYILLLFKIITADNGFWPDDINQFGNNNLEKEELKTETDASKNSNPAILYYYGSNNPTFSQENPDYMNVVLNETEEKQPTLESKTVDFNNQETNMYNNYELVKSLKDTIFNDLSLTTNLRANEVTYLKDLRNPSDIKTYYIQQKEPETFMDNITNYEKIIDVQRDFDVTKLTNNYEYEPHPPSKSIDIFNNFILKLLEDKNKLKPNVKIEAISSQCLPEHIAKDLPKIPLNDLPIISTNVQPNMNIIFKNTPRHHNHNIRQHFLILPKLIDGLHPNYNINDFPSKIYT